MATLSFGWVNIPGQLINRAVNDDDFAAYDKLITASFKIDPVWRNASPYYECFIFEPSKGKKTVDMNVSLLASTVLRSYTRENSETVRARKVVLDNANNFNPVTFFCSLKDGQRFFDTMKTVQSLVKRLEALDFKRRVPLVWLFNNRELISLSQAVAQDQALWSRYCALLEHWKGGLSQKALKASEVFRRVHSLPQLKDCAAVIKSLEIEEFLAMVSSLAKSKVGWLGQKYFYFESYSGYATAAQIAEAFPKICGAFDQLSITNRLLFASWVRCSREDDFQSWNGTSMTFTSILEYEERCAMTSQHHLSASFSPEEYQQFKGNLEKGIEAAKRLEALELDPTMVHKFRAEMEDLLQRLAKLPLLEQSRKELFDKRQTALEARYQLMLEGPRSRSSVGADSPIQFAIVTDEWKD